jgi:diphthamide biosynthesis protein 4
LVIVGNYLDTGQDQQPEWQPHIHNHISLDSFTPHYTSSQDPDLNEPSYYTHPCRCSGKFLITLNDLEDGVEVIGCEGCGEWAKVGYVAVEDEQEGHGAEEP